MRPFSNAVIVHGKPTRERYDNPALPKPHQANWLPWLAGELGPRGIPTAVPSMPRPYEPNFKDWCEVFEQQHIGPDTALIGFSAGADFIWHWLSERPAARVGAVALVAPWRDLQGKYGEFSQYTPSSTIDRQIGACSVFYSLDDTQSVLQTVGWLRNQLPRMQAYAFTDRGHFMIGNNMSGPEFYELQGWLLGAN